MIRALLAFFFGRPYSVADEQRRRRYATAERMQRETYNPEWLR